MNRRSFLNTTALAAPTIFAAATPVNMPDKNIFVHHVYFWLKNPDSKADKAKLVEGLQKLSKVRTIKMFHIGQPAAIIKIVHIRSGPGLLGMCSA